MDAKRNIPFSLNSSGQDVRAAPWDIMSSWMNISTDFVVVFNHSLNGTVNSSDEPSYEVKVTLMSTYFIIGVLTAILNIFVLVVIGRFSWMRTNTNIIIASLAVTDLVAGILGFGAGLIKYGEFFHVGMYFCYVYNITDVTVAHASLYHVLAVNVERYLAITKPLQYKKWFTKRLLCLYMVIVWALSLGLALLYVFNMHYLDRCLADVPANVKWTLTTLILTYPLPLLIIFAIYVRIVTVTKHHFKFQRRHSASQRNPRNPIRKMMKNVGVIFAAYIVCWGPAMFVLIAVNISMLKDQEVDLSRYVMVFYFTEVLAYANSFLNPIIYFLGNRSFKKAAKKMFNMRRDSSAAAPSQSQVTCTPNTSVINLMNDVTRF